MLAEAGERGGTRGLVLGYIIKPRCSFLKEQKEAKDSLIETWRLLLQERPEQAGRGRASALAGGRRNLAGPGPWSWRPLRGRGGAGDGYLAWEPPLGFLGVEPLVLRTPVERCEG